MGKRLTEGDKVVVNYGTRKGETGIIVKDDYSDVPYLVRFECGEPYWFGEDDVESAVEDANVNLIETVTKLWKRIDQLEATVKALKDAESDKRATPQATGLTTDSLRRAEAIVIAKDTVEGLRRRAAGFMREHVGNYTFRNVVTKPSFYVNREKGVVTAVLKGKDSGDTYEVGLARLTPGDVFNEDIGKAIALSRACGLPVPEELLSAPNPDVRKAGQVVVAPYYANGVRASRRMKLTDSVFPKLGEECSVGSYNGKTGVLVEDTGVEYGE